MAAWPAKPSMAVIGLWKKACQDIDGDYLIEEMNVEKDSWSESQVAFENADCTSPYIRFERQYALVINSNNRDLTLQNVFYTPMTAEGAQVLNEIEFCGVSNWKLDVRQSMLNKDCGQGEFFIAGTKLYSIFKLSSDQKLFLGEASENFDGSAPSKRHLQYGKTGYSR